MPRRRQPTHPTSRHDCRLRRGRSITGLGGPRMCLLLVPWLRTARGFGWAKGALGRLSGTAAAEDVVAFLFGHSTPAAEGFSAGERVVAARLSNGALGADLLRLDDPLVPFRPALVGGVEARLTIRHRAASRQFTPSGTGVSLCLTVPKGPHHEHSCGDRWLGPAPPWVRGTGGQGTLTKLVKPPCRAGRSARASLIFSSGKL